MSRSIVNWHCVLASSSPVREQSLTRERDSIAAECRRHPWLGIEKEYLFGDLKGIETLVDLFEGRRQLIIYRFFFEEGAEGWPDAG
jgi:predicted dithiol-disulfide oxidoreductase (DUF899 family)